MLDIIEDTAKSIKGQLISAGDLNLKPIERGIPYMREESILEIAVRLGLIVLKCNHV